MNTTVKRFAWHDRDTAARDMLQLVYLAPPSVSRNAIQLLEAFRSAAILPELEAILADESQNVWQRIYALRAITAVPGDLFRPQFAMYMELSLENHARYDHRGRVIQHDLLDFVDKHPSNRTWFFEILDSAGADVQFNFLSGALYHAVSDEMSNLLLQKLLNLLDALPSLVNDSIISSLLHHETPLARKWLEQHFEIVVEMSLINVAKREHRFLANTWEKLHLALIERDKDYARRYEIHLSSTLHIQAA